MVAQTSGFNVMCVSKDEYYEEGTYASPLLRSLITYTLLTFFVLLASLCVSRRVSSRTRHMFFVPLRVA